MRTQEHTKAERLEARVSREQKSLYLRAAQLRGRSLSDFCVTALNEAARKTIAEQDMLVLSDRDRALFFDALANPPPIHERLLRAAAVHERLIGS